MNTSRSPRAARNAGVRARPAERLAAHDADAAIARQLVDPRHEIDRAVDALLDHDDLEAVVVLIEQRREQLGERPEPVVRAHDDGDPRRAVIDAYAAPLHHFVTTTGAGACDMSKIEHPS
jgi:hypothetical protein